MIHRPAPAHVALAATAALTLIPPVAAQSRPERPRPYALRGVTIQGSEDPRTIVLRDGRIEAIVDADAELSPGLFHIDASGLVGAPAFVDAYSHAGCETPEPVIDRDRPVSVQANVWIDMREANRKGVQPSFQAARVLEFGERGPSAHREQGFGLVASAPNGQLLAGRSALVSTRDAAVRDVVLDDALFQHAAFTASGDGYPSTLMGFHAQLRQMFWDAERHALISQRFARGLSAERPVHDPDLAAAVELLAGQERLVCEAETARDIRRWMRLADEFGLAIAISGGREAWKCADELAQRGIPVLLTLDWGEEVDDPDEEDAEDASETDEEPPIEEVEEVLAEGATVDESPAASGEDDDERWIYEEPIDVQRERRRRWLEGRDCAMRLAEAGVPFAFVSAGDKPKDLLERVRTLVEEGLDRDAALAALTVQPAEWTGVGGRYGELRAGKAAALALWTADPLDEDAEVAWLFVDGFAHEFDIDAEDPPGEGPAEGVDLTGEWIITTDEDDESDGETIALLEMDEDGTVTGTVDLDMNGVSREEDIEGSVSGNSIELVIEMSMEGMTITATMDGEIDGDEASGTLTIDFGEGQQEMRFTMKREPERRAHEDDGLGEGCH